jgi:hypothetical protein
MTNTEKRDLIQLVLVQADPTLADLMISQAVDSVEAIFHSKKQMTYSGDFLVAEIHSKISLEMMTTFLDMDSGEDLTRLNLKIRDRILLADLVDLHSYLLPHHFSEASLPFIMIMTEDLVAQVTVRATTATLVIAPIIQTLAAQILATPIATLVDTVELTIRLPTTKIWFMLVT